MVSKDIERNQQEKYWITYESFSKRVRTSMHLWSRGYFVQRTKNTTLQKTVFTLIYPELFVVDSGGGGSQT